MDMFRRGIERIIARTPVPVVPVHLGGLWGSMFSRKAKWQLPRLKWSLVSVSVGEPIGAEQVSANYLHEQVSALKAQHAKNAP